MFIMVDVVSISILSSIVINWHMNWLLIKQSPNSPLPTTNSTVTQTSPHQYDSNTSNYLSYITPNSISDTTHMLIHNVIFSRTNQLCTLCLDSMLL